MQPDPKVLDDIARVAGGAVNILSGLRQQLREDIKVRVEDVAARMDLVPREDVERLEVRVARLEERLAALEKTPKKAAPKKAAAKTKTAPEKAVKKTAKKTTKKKT